MAKREITCVLNTADLTVTWKAEGQDDLVLHMEKIHEDNVTYAALHGMKQRVTDAAALDKGSSVAEKFTEMKALVEHYESGNADWNRANRGGGGFKLDEALVLMVMADLLFNGDGDRASDAVKAMATKRGIPYAEAIKVWYNTDTMKPEYATRQARRNAKGNADELLAEIA